MNLSDRAAELAASYRFVGSLDKPTGQGIAGDPGGGPYLMLDLHIEGGVVQSARYRTFGCPTARACGAALCLLIEGRERERAKLLEECDVVAFLGGIPEGKGHCPRLAIDALRLALDSAQS